MKDFHWIAVALVLFVTAIFLRDANAATFTVQFDSVQIHQNNGRLSPGCLMRTEGKLLVLAADCSLAATTVRNRMCGLKGLDVDAKFTCPKLPLDTMDFIVDGEAWSAL